MQKKLIALAVAGLVSGVAFAQTNVTIYGSLDESYTYAKGKNPTPGVVNTDDRVFSGLTDGQYNGNRIGFKGEEALGNGLKAVFTYEYGTALQGQGGLNNVRQAFVGLGGNWGTVTFGRQYAPSGSFMGRNSAWDIASTTALNNILNNEGATGSPLLVASMGTGNTSRWNNSVAFNSATYAGFSGRAIYAFSNVISGNSATNAGTYETSTTDNGKLGLSLAYANGPLNVDAIYQKQFNVRVSIPSVAPILTGLAVPTATANSFVGTGDDIDEWFLGAGYDFKVVKAFATYQSLKNKNTNDVSYNGDAKIWSLGAYVPVGAAGKVRAEYARVNFDSNATTNLINGSTSGLSVGYTHDMSKRTMLYTSVTRMKNDSDSAALGLNGVGGISVAGESSWVFTSGVRHFF